MVVAYGNQSFFNAGRAGTNPQYLNYFTTLLLLTLLYKGGVMTPPYEALNNNLPGEMGHL